ncbi:uncharacterized protein LOC110266794 [Arachis ipaensis]|uniref:Major facilitator superfamily (MFS) profile domain-containing protein n=1 Tax=Arachis hypogaea TaxID=3818 RepID=A0A444XI41_ARAHY|nr:uncharacterized protein LOC110266794 [Arachis ipaensis]RYQ89405.1 hypothetical protein Ahy_B09g096071 isoform A [Arachis hypogaea]
MYKIKSTYIPSIFIAKNTSLRPLPTPSSETKFYHFFSAFRNTISDHFTVAPPSLSLLAPPLSLLLLAPPLSLLLLALPVAPLLPCHTVAPSLCCRRSSSYFGPSPLSLNRTHKNQVAWWLYIGRLLVGCGMGLLSFVVPVYVAEVTPKNLRGGFTTVHQLMICCGVSLTYLIGAFLNWRILALIGIIPCSAQVLSLPFIPESPRWLAKVGHLAGNENSL